MATLMEKLDRQAKKLVDILDGQLEQPVAKILSGEVFTYDANIHPAAQIEAVEPAKQAAPAIPSAYEPKPAKRETASVPVLRKANS